MREKIVAVQRNKYQKWLLIASGVLFLAAILSLNAADDKQVSTKVDYSSLAVSDLLRGANENYSKGDFKEALPLLEEAANRGSARAQYSLGYMFQNAEGVDADLEKARTYYKMAADNGHAKARNALKKLGG